MNGKQFEFWGYDAVGGSLDFQKGRPMLFRTEREARESGKERMYRPVFSKFIVTKAEEDWKEKYERLAEKLKGLVECN